MRTHVLFLVALILFSFPCFATETQNYCHDPASEAHWQALLAKNPKDYDLQAFHALRMGLCIKVDRGVLSVEEATAIFERAREALIRKREAESKPKENEAL